MMPTITVASIPPEHSGDWHDPALKYVVAGPGAEKQKFFTKKAALKYASLRRRSATQWEAMNQYARL